MDYMTKRELEIYGLLADEKSKQIFMLRKKWAESGSADFVPVFDGRHIKPYSDLYKKLNGKTFVCYGAGEGCRHLLRGLREFQMTQNCRAVFDGNTALHGKKIDGHPISAFNGALTGEVDFLIVTPETYTISDEINKYLLGVGIQQNKIILFSDYFALNDIDLYFDQVVTDRFGGNEIFIDGGCLDFSSSLAFLKHCPNAKKIYAFEPNANQIGVIKKAVEHSGFQNVKLINGALWSHDTELCFEVMELKSASRISEDEAAAEKVRAFALDDAVDAKDRVTFIKMDIEGAELAALEGARTLIMRDKPTLAISLYHKPEDYVAIPMYLKGLVPAYNMYFRHYSSIYSETVLYCVMAD